MKLSTKVLLMVISLTLALFSNSFAQQSLFKGCSSAGNTSQSVQFNCDLPDTLGFSVNSASLHYMAQGGTNFSQATMTVINDAPFYTDTYESSVNFAVNPNILQYYFSGDSDSIRATQSPKNTDNQFPPSIYKYAEFIDDPTGDAYLPAGNWLDLTGSGMSYYDTRIYGYLENVSGTWPLNEGLFTYFVYGIGFVVTTETDSLFYALGYANVLGILTTGLYRINLSDSTYDQIGDIDVSVSGGRLHMACDFTEFENDPDWSGWPPPDGFLVSMGATITADLSNQTFNDYTLFTFYEPVTLYEDFNTNDIPVLQAAHLDVVEGENITPRIEYSDSNNDLPTLREFYLDFASFDMKSYDHVYSDISEFEAGLTWPEDGLYYYYFRFSDGLDTVITEIDSILIGNPGYEYLPGDVNMSAGTWPPSATGPDVTYLVNFFRGIPSSQSCLLGGFWASADANGDCNVIGSDVTKLVNVFRGIGSIGYCAEYEPAWHNPSELPPSAPSGWPGCDVVTLLNRNRINNLR